MVKEFADATMKTLRRAVGITAVACVATMVVSPAANVTASKAADGEIVAVGAMESPRSGHTATRLWDGKVLIVGGMVRNGEFVADAELYDANAGGFFPAGRMTSPRVGHTATLLPDGRVLIAGGSSRPDQNVERAEIYDPAMGRFEATASLLAARSDAEAVLLPGGKVLIAGGTSGSDWDRLASAEIYNPALGKFQTTGSMGAPRVSFTMCELGDGRVLVTGGTVAGRYPNAQVTATAEVYDSNTGRFTSTGSMMVPRHKHAAVLLADGRVLIVGGSDQRDWRGKFDSAEIYDPVTRKFAEAGKMDRARFKLRSAVVRMPDGRVLIGGGAGQVEIFDPISQGFHLVPGPEMDGRYFSTATLLADSRVLITGGYGENVEPSSDHAWIYIPRGRAASQPTAFRK